MATNTKKEVRKCSKELEERLAGAPSTAQKVRILTAEKWETADIARKLGIIYQHAWNEQHRTVKHPRT